MNKNEYANSVRQVALQLVKIPLIHHPHCLLGSGEALKDALGQFVSSITFKQFIPSHGGQDRTSPCFLNWIKQGDAMLAFLEPGTASHIECWQDQYYAVVFMLDGRARLAQFPPARPADDGLFFIKPDADIYFQFSAYAPQLVFRIKPAGPDRDVVHTRFSDGEEQGGAFDAAVRDFMRALPFTLHYAMPHKELCQRLEQMADYFVALCRDPKAAPRPSFLPLGKPDQRVERVVNHLQTLPLDQYDPDYLCGLANMSQRGLYYAFERQMGCSPYRFLLASRLVTVRLALLLDTERRHTISWYASQEGFRHMSRFAAQYGRFFGELPSETLTRQDSVLVGEWEAFYRQKGQDTAIKSVS
ncbi:helix-turn-helix domain-containing protein [Marinobacteraceae bacterium S3BR75-40.1]